jgi:hypothetical protein
MAICTVDVCTFQTLPATPDTTPQEPGSAAHPHANLSRKRSCGYFSGAEATT